VVSGEEKRVKADVKCGVSRRGERGSPLSARERREGGERHGDREGG